MVMKTHNPILTERANETRTGSARADLARGSATESSLPSEDDLVAIHRAIVFARELDDLEIKLRRQGRMLFQVSCAGHEAVQAVAAHLLDAKRDWFYPYYRDRTFALTLGMSPEDLLRQGLGKETDPSSGGRQMPNHFASPELHIVSQSSPTGTQFLQAVGTAEAGQIARESRADGETDTSVDLPEISDGEVVYVSSGEGATSEGEFFEAVSAACLKRLPVLFVIQDNEYAISVPVEEQTPGGSISRLLSGFPDLLSVAFDGTDVVETHEALSLAIDHCRSGKGPAVAHARVVRLSAHSDSDDDSVYRTEHEKTLDRSKDPLERIRSLMISESILSAREIDEIHREAKARFQAAADVVLEEVEPAVETAERYLFNPRTVTTHETAVAASDPDAAVNLVTAINRTLSTEMERDARIVVFGEDIADCSRVDQLDEVAGKGGVFKATAELQRGHGSHRVFNSQLAEASIVGRAVGMAARGLRPVVEIQFFDYIWPAMNQIRNEVAMMRWRSNNAFSCPLVIRAPIGGYIRGGAMYHSQSGEAIFCHCPGLRVVMPSNAQDASGLLRASIRSGDPVLFLEHKHLYRQKYASAPLPGPDYVIPLGKARTAREGDDVTLVTYGALVERSLEAAEALADEGIQVEVIDLRSLVPYDWDAIAASVERTGRLVVAYEENQSFGFGAEIAARAADELFEQLDAPVGRIGSLDTPVGYAEDLASGTLPSQDDLLAALRKTVKY